MKKLTAENINASSNCPRCGRYNQLNLRALSDSDQRVYQKWLECGSCGWDQRETMTTKQTIGMRE